MPDTGEPLKMANHAAASHTTNVTAILPAGWRLSGPERHRE
jgi:hypothetical protein